MIQSERERLEVELAPVTFATSGTDAKHVGVTRAFETMSVGQAEIALVAVFIVVEAFGARMVVVADA